MRRAGLIAALALGAFVAGCAGEPEPERAVATAVRDVPEPPARTKPGSMLRDLNDDGFISASEAAGYYARRFGELDQDGDALLSREEIAQDLGTDADAGFAAIDLDRDLMIDQQEYFQARSDLFRRSVDPSSGMMSTSDFDTMIGRADPPIAEALDPTDR